VSWSSIEDKGSFTLGFDQAFPPMGFKDESGEFVGFDIDMAKEVASRLGVELILQPINWDTKTVELDNGNIDMIWNGLTINENNKKDMLFSDPYMNNRQIVVVAADSGIKTIADLTGKVVAAQIDSSGLAAIEAQPDVMATFADLIQAPDYVEAFMELKQGTVDAVVVDEIFGRYHISQENATDTYSVLDEGLGDEQYGIGFRMGDQAFRDKIQETLAAMIADGTAAEISQKWFAENIVIAG
jgi:polar amino acid transport system substrate-binding protein